MSKSGAALFLGSGISRDSDALTVEQITDRLLEGAWKAHTDWRFYPRRENEEPSSAGDAQRAQEFLRIVKDRIAPHIWQREGRQANYEDLYSAVRQIVQDEMGEVTNPLIAGTTTAIKALSAPLHVGQKHHIDRNAFASLADRAADLVQWAVYFGLVQAQDPQGMDVIGETAKATGDLDIFSLNHDVLIEAQLRKAGVVPLDGFGEKRGDVRIFNGNWGQEDRAVRLLKLHGSINWFRYRFAEWDQFAVVEGDIDHAKDENGKLLSLLNPSPMFLTGTTVKEQVYGHGLFGELFFQFRSLLSRHRTLICCGYGWGDKGINIRLDQWLRDTEKNSLVILHPDWENEARGKPFWWRRWVPYRDAGKIVVIAKWLKDCTVSDLEPYFG